MFPAEWSARQPTKRRRRPTPTPPSPAAAAPAPHDASAVDARAASDTLTTLRRCVNTAVDVPMTPAELNLDVILSRVPFRTMVNSLFDSETYAQPSVPVVCKAYEESFMREPVAGERPCPAAAMCECMHIDPTNPFVGVEFALPGAKPSTLPDFCVLCARKVTQKLFYDVVLAHKEIHGVIQRFGNLCGVPGEYARECMLICPAGGPLHNMPVPIMSHQRNKYKVRIVNGLRSLLQLKVAHEDFQPPSASKTA